MHRQSQMLSENDFPLALHAVKHINMGSLIQKLEENRQLVQDNKKLPIWAYFFGAIMIVGLLYILFLNKVRMSKYVNRIASFTKENDERNKVQIGSQTIKSESVVVDRELNEQIEPLYPSLKLSTG